MLFGKITIDGEAVRTHHTSYSLSNVSAVSARRPFLVLALIVGGGVAAWAMAFADLLYNQEILASAGVGVAVLCAGFFIGQLKLHSLAFRGNEEVSSVLWGSYRHLNKVRAEIDALLPSRRGGGQV